jgi:hypothetical protein
MRGLISAAVAVAAVVIQLAVADRLAFPGGTGPDLVLLTVAAVALGTGPLCGALTGFCAGLALDVAPPAGHLVGQDALVFCLVGYACGLFAAPPAAEGHPEQEHSALLELGVTAAGAVCGEAMIAGLGIMVSDPRVTWPAIKHVLPVAAGYDVLLSPFALLAVAAALRVAAPRTATVGRSPVGRGAAGRSPAGKSLVGRSAVGRGAVAVPARRPAWAGQAAVGAAAGSVRQLSGSGSPRLRLSGQGTTVRSGSARSALSGREPRLKLGHGAAASGRPGRPGGNGLVQRGRSAPAGLRFGGRRGQGVLGGSLLGGSFAGRSVASFAAGGSALASSRLGAVLLGGSVFGRPASPFGRPASPFGRSASPFGRSASSFGRSGALAGGPGKLHAGSGPHVPRFRKEGAFARLIRGLRRSGQRKRPGKGWLRAGPGSARGTSRSLRSPGHGWLGKSVGLGRSAKGGTTPGLRRRSPSFSSRRVGPGRLGGVSLGSVSRGSVSRGIGRVSLGMGRPRKPKRKRRSGGYR